MVNFYSHINNPYIVDSRSFPKFDRRKVLLPLWPLRTIVVFCLKTSWNGIR